MTEAERNLLLAVARVLRAKIKDEVYAAQEDDLWALNEALTPFDGIALRKPVNQAASR